ncbi:MAG: hypothetical protein AAFR96_01270 [Planctomycetota bacterium]
MTAPSRSRAAAVLILLLGSGAPPSLLSVGCAAGSSKQPYRMSFRPQVVSESPGSVEVDLRQTSSPNPTERIGTLRQVRVDTSTFDVTFSDGVVVRKATGDAEGVDRMNPNRFRYGFLADRAVSAALKYLGPEAKQRLDSMEAAAEHREQEAIAARQAEQARVAAEAERRAAQRQLEQAQRFASQGYEPHPLVFDARLAAGPLELQRVHPDEAVRGQSFLIVPIDDATTPDRMRRLASATDPVSLVDEATKVLTFSTSNGQRRITVTTLADTWPVDSHFYTAGGFAEDRFALVPSRVTDEFYWQPLPDGFGVSRHAELGLLLTDGATDPGLVAAMVPIEASAVASVVEAQRDIGRAWYAAIEDRHAQGLPVESIEFPRWADSVFTADTEVRRYFTEGLIGVYNGKPAAALHDESTGWFAEAVGKRNTREKVLFVALHQEWAENHLAASEPVQQWLFTQDGYITRNGWGTIIDRRDPISEIVIYRDRFAEAGERVYPEIMSLGGILEHRRSVRNTRAVIRLFYSLYPPGSPTANKLESMLLEVVNAAG